MAETVHLIGEIERVDEDDTLEVELNFLFFPNNRIHNFTTLINKCYEMKISIK